jgi:type I restriction enzyme, R subunit
MTIDWHVRKSARAEMRRIVKRLLRKYDYPPDQAKKALDIVMHQAELMAEHTEVLEWVIEQAAEAKGEYKMK